MKDKLSTIHVEVNIPGVFSNQLTVDNQGNPLSHPVIFYYELGKASLTNTTPKDISKVTKSVIDDNLKGLLILYQNHTMESIGAASTKWWKFM